MFASRLCRNQASFLSSRKLTASFSTGTPSVIYSWGVGSEGQLGHAKFEMSTTVLGEKYLQEEPRKMLKSKRFQQLAVGETFSLGLTHEGDLFGWGSGLVEFGGKSKGWIKEPVPLVTGEKITSIAAGTKHAAFVTGAGQVYTWGYGGGWFSGGGQLGHGSTAAEERPRVVDFFKTYGAKIASIALGHQHSLFLTDDGEVLSCGVGEYGLLGNDDSSDQATPVSLLETFGNQVITQIVAGQDHSLALTSEGKVYAWGRNNHGQLGQSDTYMDIYSVETMPKLIEVESQSEDETKLNEKIKFQQIAASNGRSAAVTSDGQLYVWGHRFSHQPKLIDCSLFNGLAVKKVACGGDSARSVVAVITEDHALWTFGDASSGLLGRPGVGQLKKHLVPERVTALQGKKVLDVFAGLGQHIFAKVQMDE